METSCAGCVLVEIDHTDAPTDRLSIHTGGDADAALVVLVTAVATMLDPEVLGDVPEYAGLSLIEILEGVCVELGIRSTRNAVAGMLITFDLGAYTVRMDKGNRHGPTQPMTVWLAMASHVMKRRYDARQLARQQN